MARLAGRRRLCVAARLGVVWWMCGWVRAPGTAAAVPSGAVQSAWGAADSAGAAARGVSGNAASAAPTAVDSASATAPAERDVIDLLAAWILHRRIEPQFETTTPNGIAWSILPTLSYNPSYGFAFGASVAGAGILGTSSKSRSSALYTSANYSTTGQLQVQFRSDVYTPSGDYLLKADVRYLDTERSTWGLGPFDASQGEYPMSFKLMRLYATIYRRAAGPAFVGIGYHFDEYTDIVDDRAALGESTPFATYSGENVTHTRAAGISLNLLGDTRDNLVNTTQGYYLSGSFRDYVQGLGADRNWQEFWLDVRLYPHLPARSKNILAFWLYSWLTFGPAPYLDLPASGWDTQGRGARGYLQGRIRGANQMYGEVEYRAQLTRDGLLGAVLFYNFTTTTLPEEKTFGKADHGLGIGLRLKFNKRSDTNLAIDHAWGKGSSRGWYMGMTEVF